MDADTFEQLLAIGHESIRVEFKDVGPRTKESAARVTRAILAMSNQRGGGHVILGVSEGEDGTPTPTGLSQETISTWTHDEVSGVVGGYADPHVDFSTSRLTYNGKTFIVYTVNEFDTVPVLCKKDFSDVLRDGALYVRTSNPPASKAVPSHAAMRDVIELATDKNVRQLVSRASDAGLLGTQPIAPPSDNERFYRQLKGTPFE